MIAIENSDDKNKNGCEKCHADKWGASVGCSSCHSISKNHGEWNVKDNAALADSKKCTNCHTNEYHNKRYPDFGFAKNWLKIAH